MTANVIPLDQVVIAGVPVEIPSKCASADAAESPANPCTEPGSLPRCMICPASPNYYRREAA